MLTNAIILLQITSIEILFLNVSNIFNSFSIVHHYVSRSTYFTYDHIFSHINFRLGENMVHKFLLYWRYIICWYVIFVLFRRRISAIKFLSKDVKIIMKIKVDIYLETFRSWFKMSPKITITFLLLVYGEVLLLSFKWMLYL